MKVAVRNDGWEDSRAPKTCAEVCGSSRAPRYYSILLMHQWPLSIARLLSFPWHRNWVSINTSLMRSAQVLQYLELPCRLQSVFESRSTAPAASAFTCTGEAFLRSSATASTSAPDTDFSSARSWSQSLPGCAVSRSFVSSATLRADPVPPIR